MFNITGYTNMEELEYVISFVGIILVAISSSYLCCKIININNQVNQINEIQINEIQINENQINNEINNNNNNNNNNEINENQILLPKYKLRDDPPEYV